MDAHKRKISQDSLQLDNNNKVDFEKSQFLSLRRPSKRASNAVNMMMTSAEEAALWEMQCLLPNGVIIDSLVHPDDEISNLKQVILNRAITDGKLNTLRL